MPGNLMQSRSRFGFVSIGGRCVLQLAFFGFGLCIMGILPLAVASKFESRDGSVNVPRVMGIIFLSVGLFFLVGGIVCLLVIAKYSKNEHAVPRPPGNYDVVDSYANQPTVHYHTSGHSDLPGPIETGTCSFGVSTIYNPPPDEARAARDEANYHQHQYHQQHHQPVLHSTRYAAEPYQPSSPIYVPYKSSPQRSLACSNPSAHYLADEPESPKPYAAIRPPSYRTAANNAGPLTCTHSPPPAYSESRYNA